MLYRANMAVKSQQQVIVEASRLAAVAGEDDQEEEQEEDAEEWGGEGAYGEEDEYGDDGYEHAACLNDGRRRE